MTQSPPENVSRAYWILPILLTVMGGLICYFVLRDRNHRKAKNMLYLGIVLTFPLYLLPALAAAVPALAWMSIAF
ncbi:MAG: hypothetical protein MPI95_03455 [Nitrosopumilus sp.]|nr:hypothetical protein [Nitrosopumilus sp.]CAI9831832.1 hypothetical protein IBTHAUMO2_450039 [Nitrosopumilaceae archaeon]MDA7941665.1 hypothetical protein [Nitrosopumilus sp.]MDA7943760.1 hypothetical protein [Nitrosopumilus sp.]MDA7945124.1 hypothetical protein [Nitrosopumilus sp.]